MSVPAGRMSTAEPDPPTVYTIGEAAAILKVKPSWLERKAANRQIPFTLLGGAYRFTRDHIFQIIGTFEQLPRPENGHRRETRRASASRDSSAVPLLRPRPPVRSSVNRDAA